VRANFRSARALSADRPMTSCGRKEEQEFYLELAITGRFLVSNFFLVMYANVQRLLRLFNQHIGISIHNNFPETGKGYSICYAIYINCIPECYWFINISDWC